MYWYDDEVESSTIGLVQWHWLIDIEIEMTKVRWMTNTQTQTQRGSTRVKVEGFLNSDPSIILPIKKYYSLTFHNYYSLFHLASHISLFSSNSARPGTCITRSLGLVGLAAAQWALLMGWVFMAPCGVPGFWVGGSDPTNLWDLQFGAVEGGGRYMFLFG